MFKNIIKSTEALLCLLLNKIFQEIQIENMVEDVPDIL